MLNIRLTTKWVALYGALLQMRRRPTDTSGRDCLDADGGTETLRRRDD